MAITTVVVGILVGGVSPGCSLPLAVPTPTLQAPSFQYIERPRLQSAMWTFADSVTALDHLLGPEAEGEVPQQQVIDILEGMEVAAATVSAPGQATNHPRLDQELQGFQLDIAAARAAAAATPPDYRRAAAVPLACLRCHRR